MRDVRRRTEDLITPRQYKRGLGYPHWRVTCVHAFIDNENPAFAGSISETHHILVEKQGIRNTCGNILRFIRKLKEKAEYEEPANEIIGEFLGPPDMIPSKPRMFFDAYNLDVIAELTNRIIDATDQIEDAVKVLKVQTENQW